ncbi:MAG: manganese efflux pump MntP family protein [Christensenellales bacterium]|jgi:putative Mn2+ efflux pump MntP
MDFFSLMLLALSLSMDAFAVSISTGITLKQVRPWHAIKTGLFFGGFQALMPLIGYLAGNTVAAYIVNVDHWIAFILLGFIGVRMIIEAVKESEECPKGADPTRTRNLLVLAVATSIDALAVGVSLALMQVDILFSAATIGVTTFALSALGVLLGRKLGCVFQKWAEIAGGVVLVGIGLKILVEHLFF